MSDIDMYRTFYPPSGATGADTTIAAGQGAVTDGNVLMPDLPVADPEVEGAVFNDGGVLTVSAGPP